MPLDSGRVIAHYAIVAPLGRGGMGEVYVARDTKLDRLVALKVLPARLASDPQHRSRFEREARAIAALQHPNIVTVHSVEEAEGIHFITMELIEGRRLSEMIPADGMELDDLLRVALPLARAVGAAHDHNIVHRDLKPENVMFDGHGQLKVLDFGLAKLSAGSSGEPGPEVTVPGSLTQEGTIVGTAAYMSPEQAEGKAVGPRSDVFSLGVILYQMSTGRRPFRGDSEVSVLSAVLRDTPAPVTSLNPSLPDNLASIIHRCLAKEPSKRFANASELEKELLKLPPSSGRANRAAPRLRRWPLMVAAGAVVLVLVTAVGIVLTRSRTPTPDAPQQVAVAVLPFENLSPDPDSRYFSDGITEEITSKLTRIGEIRVASRTAAARFRATTMDPQKIGRELGVDYLLQGSVRRAGERVRIVTQLVTTSSGFQVWTDEFEGDMSDVFRLQEETALKIADALDLRLSPGEQEAVRRRHTRSPQAFDAYLRGRALLEYFDTPEKLDVARSHLERALELDPDYPLALVGLSRVEAQYFRNIDPREERLGHAEDLARRALTRDPQLAEAHVALAQVLGNRYDYAQAAERCRMALQIEPGNAYAWDLVSWALAYQQPPDAEGAEDAARRAISLQASLIGAYYHLGRALLLQDRNKEALAAFDQARMLDPSFETADFGAAQVSLAEGDLDGALALLGGLQTTARAPVILAFKASLHAARREDDQALAALAESLEAGYRDLIALRANRSLDLVRRDPRYSELLRRYGLQP